jgi:hypothetical protein
VTEPRQGLLDTPHKSVNVANVAPDTVLDSEATRTGLGVAGPLPSQL